MELRSLAIGGALLAGAGAIAYAVWRMTMPGEKIEQGLAEGRALWAKWAKLDQNTRRFWVQRFVNEGIGDKRKDLGDYANLWCGAFAAWILRHAVHPAIRARVFPSTIRFRDAAAYGPSFAPGASVLLPSGARQSIRAYHQAHGGLRKMASPQKSGVWSFTPEPGDIGLVGKSPNNPSIPAHIVVVESYDASRGVIRAINGNGGGVDPAGRTAYGVVMTTFRPDQVVNLIRLAPADFDLAVRYSKDAPTT